MNIFSQLPEAFQMFLLEGYQREVLETMSGDDLKDCLDAHLTDLLDEGVIERKDAKSKRKQFQKLIKKVA